MKNKKYIAGILAAIAVLAIPLLLSLKYLVSSDENQKETEFISGQETPAGSDSSDNVSDITFEYTAVDVNVIPDKYNTGVTGDKLVKAEAGVVDGVTYNSSPDGLDINFWKNAKLNGTVLIENLDFSAGSLSICGVNKIESDVTLVFNNCKFYKFIAPEATCPKLKMEFNRCSFVRCSGSGMTLNSCYFADETIDGLVPYNDVYVYDCYFADKAHRDTKYPNAHTDGAQIYGSSTAGCGNIHFENCRFELPDLKGNGSTVNACIMFQIEFCEASDITFNNCRINGGGYPIYAWSKKGYPIHDSSISNIMVGCSYRWKKIFYPEIDEGIQISNVNPTDRLYVASVWKDTEQAHLSVSNDTNEKRTLLVVTDKGEKTYSIPACPRYVEFTYSLKFSDMPFDIDLNIGEAEWVKCFDVTGESPIPVRCVNFGEGKPEKVTEQEEESEDGEEEIIVDDIISVEDERPEETIVEDSIIAEGSCGKTTAWKLSSNGTLFISGSGSTADYDHTKPAPWNSYKNDITTVIFENGITRAGNQLFTGFTELKEVILPDTVVNLGNGTFSKCSALKSIIIPGSVMTITKYCFNGTSLTEIGFTGTRNQLAGMNVETGNDSFKKCRNNLLEEMKTSPEPTTAPAPTEAPEPTDAPVPTAAPEPTTTPAPAETPEPTVTPVPTTTPDPSSQGQDASIASGMCGANVSWTFGADGTLYVNGFGDTYNYDYTRPAPWNDFKSQITGVVFSEGISSIGHSFLSDAVNLKSVSLSGTITNIGNSAFKRCWNIGSLYIPSSVTGIANNCFGGISFSLVIFEGSYVNVGSNNGNILNFMK